MRQSAPTLWEWRRWESFPAHVVDILVYVSVAVYLLAR